MRDRASIGTACAIFFFLTAFSLASCAFAGLFATIDKGVYSGVSEREMVAVRFEEEWDRLWARHVSKISDQKAAPRVDFAKDMVVGVFAGEKPSGGHEIEIIKIVSGEKTMTVFFRETGPSSGDIVTAAMTQPYHLVKTDRHDLRIEFIEAEPGEGND